MGKYSIIDDDKYAIKWPIIYEISTANTVVSYFDKKLSNSLDSLEANTPIIFISSVWKISVIGFKSVCEAQNRIKKNATIPGNK